MGPVNFPFQFGKYTLLESVSRVGDCEVYKAKAQGVEGFEKVLAVRRLFSPGAAQSTDGDKKSEHPKAPENGQNAPSGRDALQDATAAPPRRHLPEFEHRRDRFVEQARLLSSLHHNGIVQVFDMGQVDDEYYYAMEYVSGLSLQAVVQMARSFSFPMPAELVLYVTQQLAKAFDYAYRMLPTLPVQMTHDDFLLEDIMIGFEGEVKVLQFDLPTLNDLKQVVPMLAEDAPLTRELEAWLAEPVGDEAAFGTAFAELAKIARNYPRAGARDLAQYMRALKLRPAVGANLESAYDREYTKTAFDIGSVWLVQGQYDKAFPLLYESYRAARKLKLERFEHLNLRALGWLDFLRFGSEEGMEQFVLAKNWLELQGQPEDVAQNLCLQAAIERRRGNDAAAQELLDEAMKIAKEHRLGKVLEQARLIAEN